MTTISSREFNHNISRAKTASRKGPVFITDRGRPMHVLLSFEDYQGLLRTGPTMSELLAMPGGEDIEFDPPKMEMMLRIPDLS